MADDDHVPVSWTIVGYMTACVNFLAFASCLFVLQALLRSSSIRANSYNIYVIFLIFPDALHNLMVGLWNSFWRGYPRGYYEVNLFVYIFYFYSNFYLNAVVAYEINSLATASHRRQKTSPPKLSRAWKQVTLVYLFATIVSLWVVLPYKWSPLDINDGTSGILKFGSPNDGIFSPLVAPLILFGFVIIPFGYVLYIRIRIACYKLLPKRGRTRVLSLFFMRIVIVFLLFYLPNTILAAFFHEFDVNSAPHFWLGRVATPLLSASQAYVTLYMILWKEDIRKVVANAWNDSLGKCCCRMATTLQPEPSAKPSGITIYRPSGDSNVSNGPSSSPPSASLSASYRTEPTLAKKSEWDEEDFYSERRQADPGPSRPEGDQEDVHDISEEAKQEEGKVAMIEESHPSQSDDSKMGNCRDCTDTWVQEQGTPSEKTNPDESV